MNPLSREDQKIHIEAKNCKFCGNCFDHDKVRHRDHVTGCYIESCCNRCNLQLKFRKEKMQETEVRSIRLWKLKEIMW